MKKRAKVGDLVRSASGSIGIVRFIGILGGAGSPTSVWSEWSRQWDGKILSCGEGGYLKWSEDYTILERVKPKEFKIVAFMNGGINANRK